MFIPWFCTEVERLERLHKQQAKIAQLAAIEEKRKQEHELRARQEAERKELKAKVDAERKARRIELKRRETEKLNTMKAGLEREIQQKLDAQMNAARELRNRRANTLSLTNRNFNIVVSVILTIITIIL